MSNIDTMSVNAIRVLAADSIQKAKSGHPGLPLGAAAAAYELWAKHMNHNQRIRTGQTVTVLFFQVDMVQHFYIHYFIYLDMAIYQLKN